jgi:hypothetical protein
MNPSSAREKVAVIQEALFLKKQEVIRKNAEIARVTGKQAGDTQSKPAISIAGVGAGRRSRCERLAEVIGAKLEVGLSARRIYRDLVEQNDFRDGACSKALKAGTYRFKDLR